MSGRLVAIQVFLGEVARPFAIISASASASWATVDVASRVSGGEGGAIFLAAVWAGVGALYIGKAVEVTRVAGHSAAVERARAVAAPAATVEAEPAPKPPEEAPPWAR